ncbi:MAG: hypothetical protein IJF17_13405, partial [Thermoguttaceae bacterium]|nr:hypothetical protein [Thermoguttaceae bacterium]
VTIILTEEPVTFIPKAAVTIILMEEPVTFIPKAAVTIILTEALIQKKARMGTRTMSIPSMNHMK